MARALGIKLIKGCLEPIDKNNYVLTLDYASKMLNIHERKKCGVPVIIEGETGVGKTALIEMLSILWNHGYVQKLKKFKLKFFSALKQGKHCLHSYLLLSISRIYHCKIILRILLSCIIFLWLGSTNGTKFTACSSQNSVMASKVSISIKTFFLAKLKCHVEISA